MANVLLESSFKDSIEVRYSFLNIKSGDNMVRRMDSADYIFFASDYPTDELIKKYKIDMSKVWMIGLKDFGNSNGIHYNRKIENYSSYRTSVKSDILESNLNFKKQWGNRYIDLLELIADSEGKVLVFTPDGKFISHDTIHLTKYGAIFFAKLLDSKFKEIMHLK